MEALIAPLFSPVIIAMLAPRTRLHLFIQTHGSKAVPMPAAKAHKC
jgi:hypothetical protein